LLETPVTDTQCILAHTPKAAFLAFRGTEQKLADWLTDFEIKPRTPSWNGSAGYLVHSGFNEALDSIWPKIMTALAETEVLARGLPLWLTGHSLGGALAALGGLRMTEELETAESSTVIAAVFAYGQPRVGDRACAEAFDRALPNRYFRSINHRDVVARIPLPRTPDVLSKIQSGSGLEVYDYAHAGRVIFFNDVGQALMDPPLWYRKLDALPVAENVRALKNILKETTGDHAMSGYVALHRQLLETATPESATSGL
jgi:predicted lipase